MTIKQGVSHKDYLKLVLPITISSISTPLLGAVDTAVVGRLSDPSYIGGVAIGVLIFNTMYWLLGFLKVSTSAFTSQASGGQNREEIIGALLRPFFIAVLIAVFFVIMQYPIKTISLSIVEATIAVEQKAADYFDIRIWGAPFALINYCILGWLIGSSKLKTSLILQLYMNVTNIVLDIVFVTLFQYGVSGVAYATVISEISACFMGLFVLEKLGILSTTENMKKRFIFQGSSFTKMIKMNLDLFIRTICLLIVFTSFTATGASISNEVLAANAILFQIHYLIAYMYDGVSSSNNILSGRAFAQRNYSLHKQTLKISFIWGTAITLCVLVILFVFKATLISLFTNIQEVINVIETYYMWIVLYPVTVFIGMTLYGFFTGTTFSGAIRNSTIQALVLYLMLYYFTVDSLGNHGLWLAFICFTLGRSIFLLLYLPRFNTRILENCKAS